jgi:predicted nucleic acid-binding protein
VITAVDSSVLLDVLCADPHFATSSEKALRTSMADGQLVVCECVIAEITPALKWNRVEEFLQDWALTFVPSSTASAMLAGDMFGLYLQRGGKASRVLPDFLIGAHAVKHADRLLARDRGYLRDYFRHLKLIQP